MKPKIFIISVLVISLYSCIRLYRNNEGVLRPKKINFKLKKEQNLDKFHLIDTLCVYELYATWLGDYNFYSTRKEDYVLMDEYRYYNGDLANFKIFLRFYSNGNVSFFSHQKTKVLSKETFNPANGIIGVSSFDYDVLFIEEFSFRGHEGQYIMNKVKIKGDTIHLIGKLSGFYTGKHKIFIKKEIAKEFLDWKSDW